jgi:hypothetical protein
VRKWLRERTGPKIKTRSASQGQNQLTTNRTMEIDIVATKGINVRNFALRSLIMIAFNSDYCF